MIRSDDFDVYFWVINYEWVLFKKCERAIAWIKLLPLSDWYEIWADSVKLMIKV